MQADLRQLSPAYGVESGLFSPLISRAQTVNPTEFQLPEDIRNYFRNGEPPLSQTPQLLTTTTHSNNRTARRLHRRPALSLREGKVRGIGCHLAQKYSP
jgi:hypothetical protein